MLFPRLMLTDDETDIRIWSGADDLVDRCNSVLMIWAGSWQFDTRLGVRNLDRLLAKPADPALWRAEVHRVLLDVPGILAVGAIGVTVDTAARTATITWAARGSTGPITGAVTID